MRKSQLVSGVLLLSLSGCSSIGSGWNNTVDFVFGPDDGAGQRQEAAAKIAAGAAGSANPEQALVDGVVKKSVDKAAMSTAAAIDSSMAYSKTDISITGIKSKKTRYFITNVKGFEPSDDGQAQTFMQSSIGNANSRTVINFGLGRRYLSDDETVLTGFNAFLDYDPKYGHQRASIGAELKASAFELTANSYKALTKWKKGKSGNQERALDGHDIELGRRDYDGLQKDENFGQLTYTIPMGAAPAQSSKPLFSSEMFESASMKDKMLDKVRRNNAIVIQTKFVAAVGGV